MGRVRKYKKFKACDPASKKRATVDTMHDEPPALFEQKANQRSAKRKQLSWDNEDSRELLLQREALRQQRHNQSIATTNVKNERKVEPKKSNESTKQFKSRLREETRKTLAEEIQKMTATSKKRKERLKARSEKRKSKRNGSQEQYQEEKVEFFSAASGHLRPSDLGNSSSTFARTERIAFNERVDRPPDLNSFAKKLRTSKEERHQQLKLRNDDESSDNMTSVDSDPDTERHTQQQPRKRVKHAGNIMYRDDMDGDDGIESTINNRQADGIIHMGSFRNRAPPSIKSIETTSITNNVASGSDRVQSRARNGKKHTVAVASGSSVAEMEKLRSRVQDAYRNLKERRKLQK